MRRYYNKGAKGLSGGQVKLDKMGNNDGKISGEDFAVIRSKKMDGGMMGEAKEINSKIKNSRTLKMGGGMMKRNMYKAGSGKDTHVTKDGRTVKKGLYYYMNRAKKKGTSKPGKGTVTDKALKASAKTAKKPTKKA
jgi:hypothetical protein